MKYAFSIIVPVYNRPEEMHEFMASLAKQTDRDFEVVIMEGTCERTCRLICEAYSNRLDVQFYERNTGRSARRNEGMQLAKGNYFILFDSDVIVPPTYIASLRKSLKQEYVDCFGGPDSADSSFTTTQLAVNYAMTSMMTTGGIRGKMKNVYNYKPRAFNMGFSREVFETTQGYLDMIGEDVDLSMRISEAGFKVKLIKEAVVFHKRRVSIPQFVRQVNTFGKARILLSSIHKGSFRIMHAFPSCFVLGNLGLVVLSLVLMNWYFMIPLMIYCVALFFESLVKNKRLSVALLSVVTSYGQLFGYGIGFLDEFLTRRASKKNAEQLYRQ